MTNEEWLKSLPADKLCEKLLYCGICAYADDERCSDETVCSDGVLEWLMKEHND